MSPKLSNLRAGLRNIVGWHVWNCSRVNNFPVSSKSNRLQKNYWNSIHHTLPYNYCGPLANRIFMSWRYFSICEEFYERGVFLFKTFVRETIGLIGLTRVGSRRVVQIAAGFMICLSLLGRHWITHTISYWKSCTDINFDTYSCRYHFSFFFFFQTWLRCGRNLSSTNFYGILHLRKVSGNQSICSNFCNRKIWWHICIHAITDGGCSFLHHVCVSRYTFLVPHHLQFYAIR